MCFLYTGVAILLLLVVYLIYKLWERREKFGDEIAIKQTHEIMDLSKQFTDMITYENDADGRLGFDKCIENCQGYCVEYGLTGTAHCFPAREPEVKDFEGDVVPNEKKLAYPSLR